ncbi:MAG: response regulator transcription factor [Saprospiraceae bacterium]|nr:response regulator transcription factor [Saprospiraceae bacterium]
MNHRILIVEDDESIGYLLETFLQLEGFRTQYAKHGKEAYHLLQQSKFDLCLLDVIMPELDGFELAQKLRTRNQFIPIIFLTAKALKPDILKGFELGADDYLVKPIDQEELLARIKAVLRRSKEPAPSQTQFTIGTYLFDVVNQQLVHQDTIVYLTELECKLLLLLCMEKGTLVTRSYILKTLWGKEDYFARRSMDVFISKLRKYLVQDVAVQIKNIHNSGFILIEQ